MAASASQPRLFTTFLKNQNCRIANPSNLLIATYGKAREQQHGTYVDFDAYCSDFWLEIIETAPFDICYHNANSLNSRRALPKMPLSFSRNQPTQADDNERKLQLRTAQIRLLYENANT